MSYSPFITLDVLAVTNPAGRPSAYRWYQSGVAYHDLPRACCTPFAAASDRRAAAGARRR